MNERLYEPPASLHVKLHVQAAGYCKHPEFVTIRGGALRSVKIPALYACIEHPTAGLILFDTGYATRFYSETNKLPNRLYRWITPVVFKEKDSAGQGLRLLGFSPDDVRAVIISHFHADHIAGLRDFPNAKYYYTQEAYDAVKQLRGLSALRAAFLAGLIPEDFAVRSELIRTDRRIQLSKPSPFSSAMDVLGDGSIVAVELPGHARGQIGLLLSTRQHDYLLCADAVWSSQAYRENRPPHPITGVIAPQRKEYAESFDKLVLLHQQYPKLRIIPSHCSEVWEQWGNGGEPL
jgi:glyoxylase-like metal-dependent hydrolase (beta-lactamase superfamily II)